VRLTWREGVVLRYQADDLESVRRQAYPRGGWGLTHDGEHLIASDGSDRLYRLDPGSLRVVRNICVNDPDTVVGLNELEYIDGRVWANIWQEERIVIINPQSGRVTRQLDLSSLRKHLNASADILNGIAIDPITGRPLVTGKLWDKLFVLGVEDF